MKKTIINNSSININVIGLGFVGLVTAVVFAKKGFFVNGIEKNFKILKKIKNGIIHFYEPNLKENLEKFKKKMNFSSNLVIKKNKLNILFLCVGTPSKKNGNIDLGYINKFCLDLSKNKKDKFLLVVKSTVLPGTINELIRKYFKKNDNIMLCSNPEFLQEGSAFNDFLNSEKIVVGVNNNYVKKIMKFLYKNFNSVFFITTFETAEFIKYLSNSLLATLISYSNFMKILSYKIKNIELKKSFDAVKTDKRWFGKPAPISKYFHPGIGFGGSCLPKDISALNFFSSQKFKKNNLLNNYLYINSSITNEVINKSLKKFNESKKKTVVFLGTSFKPGSDDIRHSKSIVFINKFLQRNNKKYLVYDEKVKKIRIKGKIILVINKKPKFDDKYFYILLTEWKSYINFLKKIPSENFFDTREIF